MQHICKIYGTSLTMFLLSSQYHDKCYMEDVRSYALCLSMSIKGTRQPIFYEMIPAYSYVRLF